jgi:hypothetical protein
MFSLDAFHDKVFPAAIDLLEPLETKGRYTEDTQSESERPCPPQAYLDQELRI